MVALVSLDSAKQQLNIDPAFILDDTYLLALIEAASGAVINYLKERADVYLDSSGGYASDSSLTDPPDFASPVGQAVLIYVAIMYRDRDGSEMDKWDNYPPAPVRALLYPLRKPALG
jgi:hypothetical protein